MESPRLEDLCAPITLLIMRGFCLFVCFCFHMFTIVFSAQLSDGSPRALLNVVGMLRIMFLT